jgi:hypothetical protein
MVVPRSATLIAADDEFTLYAVTTFKKYRQEFILKSREQKWIPREFKYVEGGIEEERKEVDRVEADERRLWGETLRLARTGWSEAVMIWIHVFVLRVFVETVLRYGLPLDFVCVLVKVSLFFWSCLLFFSLSSSTGFPSPRFVHIAFSFIFNCNPPSAVRHIRLSLEFYQT